jgi:DnaK suppressor protein
MAKEGTRAHRNHRAGNLLKTQLEGVVSRVQEAAVPQTSVPGGDFFDIAQGVEHQELARISVSRLNERAKSLRVALARVSDGQYGLCAECGESILPKRLLVVPDATTCVACQERLERATRDRS